MTITICIEDFPDHIFASLWTGGMQGMKLSELMGLLNKEQFNRISPTDDLDIHFGRLFHSSKEAVIVAIRELMMTHAIQISGVIEDEKKNKK